MNNKTQKQKLLDELYAPYKKCLECPLGSLGRINVVFGDGNPDTTLMFIGEGPGKKEDLQGVPFVGRSGQLLNRAFALAGISREKTFITNIVKCRPPNNRNPSRQESQTCKDLLLMKQIEIIQPKIICTLGAIALEALIEKKIQITQAKKLSLPIKNSIIVPTYHPAYVLRNPKVFDSFLQDIKKAFFYAQK